MAAARGNPLGRRPRAKEGSFPSRSAAVSHRSGRPPPKQVRRRQDFLRGPAPLAPPPPLRTSRRRAARAAVPGSHFPRDLLPPGPFAPASAKPRLQRKEDAPPTHAPPVPEKPSPGTAGPGARTPRPRGQGAWLRVGGGRVFKPPAPPPRGRASAGRDPGLGAGGTRPGLRKMSRGCCPGEERRPR
jgi:hypothetical protein